MKGQLIPGFFVTLDPRTSSHSGSWIPHSGNPLQAYGQEIILLFYNQIKGLSPLTVLDLGASTGSFCLLAKFIPQMYCVAVEPVTSVRDILNHNLDLNDLGRRVRTSGVALSDYTGSGVMEIPADSVCSGLSSLKNESRPGFMSEKVVVKTLDVFCSESGVFQVNAIKLDVERSEEKVLLGGENIIRRCRPLILLEATRPDQTVPLLKDWGYTVKNYDTDLLAL